MSRYIDADLIEYHDSFTNDGEYMRVAFGDDIDVLPTADVVEVVHGEWIDKGHYTYCSICNYENPHRYNYCPECGARMDGGR